MKLRELALLSLGMKRIRRNLTLVFSYLRNGCREGQDWLFLRLHSRKITGKTNVTTLHLSQLDTREKKSHENN